MALTQISTNGIKDTTIATADIADDAVNADKLANSINTEIAANTAKVTNATHTGEVTGATALTIADNAVTLAKMAGGTDGQIITYDANGDPLAVGPGTDGQVLTSTGAGSPPAFEDAGGGLDGVTTGSGNVTISNGNLVIGTSGKGIDFSATSDGNGTDTSELLDDYEEGTWTPVLNTNAGAIANYAYQNGRYCRVGQLCYVSLFVAGAANSGLENGGSDLWITGVPYAPASFPDAHIFQWCQVNMGGESGYDSHYIGAEYYNDRFYIYGKTAGGNYGAAMGSVLTATSNVLYRGTFRLA